MHIFLWVAPVQAVQGRAEVDRNVEAIQERAEMDCNAKSTRCRRLLYVAQLLALTCAGCHSTGALHDVSHNIHS